MWTLETIGTLVIGALKLVINLVCLIIYRIGDGGYFLGIGGTWNLNEERSADVEIVASGIMVGFIIYTGSQMIAFLFDTSKNKSELSDTILNVAGTCCWVALGGVALHYWNGFEDVDNNPNWESKRTMGIVLGCLSIVEGALYLLDTVMSCLHYSKGDTDYTK